MLLTKGPKGPNSNQRMRITGTKPVKYKPGQMSYQASHLILIRAPFLISLSRSTALSTPFHMGGENAKRAQENTPGTERSKIQSQAFVPQTP